MRTSSAVFTVALFFAVNAAAHHGPVAGSSEGRRAGHFGTLSPDAPPETAEYAFLIGEWSCKTRGMSPTGQMSDGPDATWIGYYVLDGWAIQDVWLSSNPGSKPGTNIRSFNSKTGKWDNRWLAAGSPDWKYFESEKVGDTMVMTGGEGIDAMERSFVDRNVFYEISEHSWKWRKDRSFDGGENWFEGVAHIHCRAAGGGFGGDLPAEARQFDFWLGRWDVNLRIRKDGDWPDSSVRAQAEIYSILGGKAVLELWDSEPIKGFSLRYFDALQDKWMLWLNWPGKNRAGSSGLSGSFRHGRGDFYSEKPAKDGGTLISRYSFNDITPNSLRWDDAYSEDGGETWRHGWRMEFSRTADRVALAPAGGDAHTYGAGQWCDLPQFRRFEALAGTHEGTLRRRTADGWSESPARLVGYRVLEGCAVLAILSAEIDGRSFESFQQLTWNTYASVFEETTIDSDADSALAVYYGPDAEGALTLSRRAAFDEEIEPGRRTWHIDDRAIEVRVEVPKDQGDAWTPIVEAVFERSKP